jgi:hypothetical protein
MSKPIKIDKALADKIALLSPLCSGPCSVEAPCPGHLAWIAYCKTINEGGATRH